jgi:DNA-binding transcriptional LysR family regulator
MVVGEVIPDPTPDLPRRRATPHGVELRQLEAFVAVAEHGHFGHAAQALHVSQPTVSKLIRRLEEQLGTPVFVRDNRNVMLSEAGAALLADARLALDHVARGVADARAVGAGQSGLVVIGYSPAVRQTAAVVLAAFTASHPRVEVAHRQEYAIWLSRRVERADLDAAIVVSGRHPSALEAMPLRDVELACMVAAGHPLAERDRVSLADLEPHTIAAPQPDNPGWTAQVLAAAAARGVLLSWERVRDPMGMAHEMVRGRPDLVVLRPLEDLEPGYGKILRVAPRVDVRWDLVWNPQAETEVVRGLVAAVRAIRDGRGWVDDAAADATDSDVARPLTARRDAP